LCYLSSGGLLSGQRQPTVFFLRERIPPPF
jgi:hypothetical protein